MDILFFARFVFSVFLTLFLPGYLLNLLLFRGDRTDLLESIPLAFGTSLGSLTLVCLTSFLLHLGITTSFMLFLVILLVLGSLLVNKVGHDAGLQRLPGEQLSEQKNCSSHAFFSRGSAYLSVLKGKIAFLPDRDMFLLAVPALIILSVAVYSAYVFQIDVSNDLEDTMLLSMARKIYGLPGMHFDRIFFKEGFVYWYVVPLFSYVLALLSYVSGLEILQVYVKMRAVYTLLAFLVGYAYARHFFPKARELPWLFVIVAGILTLNGVGTRWSNYAFGQFMPFLRYDELAYCIVLPIGFLYFVKGLSEGWTFAAISVLVVFSLFFLHTREVIVFLVIATATICGLYFMTRDRGLSCAVEQLLRYCLLPAFFTAYCSVLLCIRKCCCITRHLPRTPRQN